MKSKPEDVRHAVHDRLVSAVTNSESLPGRDSMLEFLDFFQRAALGNGFSDEVAKEVANVFFKKFIEEFGGNYLYIPIGTHVWGEFAFKQLLDEYKKGEVSVREICRKVGCSESYVYKRIKDMGITLPDKRLKPHRLNQKEKNMNRWKKENP